MNFCPMVPWEAYEGERIVLHFVHKRGQLPHLETRLIGDLALLLVDGLGVVLREGGADEG